MRGDWGTGNSLEDQLAELKKDQSNSEIEDEPSRLKTELNKEE